MFPAILPSLFRQATLWLALLALTACGGGGGGGGSGVTPVNSQPPVAVNGCKNGPWNTPLTVDLKSYVSDPDNPVSQLTFSTSQSSKGAAVTVPVAGVVTYTPNFTITGADSFTYQVTDPAGGTATGQVKIAIGNRIMPLGDSISAGVFTSATIPTATERVGYRRKLYNDLTAGGKNTIDFVGRYNEGSGANPAIADDAHEGRLGLSDTLLSSQIAARLSGLATDAGYTAQTSTLGNGNPDIILLHIGTNGLDANPYSPANDVQLILNNINTWEGLNRPVTVLLALIIGSPNSPAGNYNCATGVDCNANAIARNTAVQTMAQGRPEFGSRLFLVDMHSALGDRTIGGDFADNLHPDTSGYEKMATAWNNALTTNSLACP